MHEVVSLSSPSGSSKDSVEYVTHSSRSHAQYSASPSLSRSSHDSDDSLRALELSDGPIKLSTMGTRARSFSMGGFNFEQDLLPLSTSLSDPGASGSGAHGESNINLVSGMCTIIYYRNHFSQRPPTCKRYRSHCRTAGKLLTFGRKSRDDILLALQIGSGIFSSPGIVIANVRSVGASLIVWLVAGLLAWTGASSFAELGSAIPLNGGAQAYLAYAYNPLTSYLFAWTAITVVKPGGNGVIALVFAEYMNRLVWHATADDASPDAIPQWAIKLTACLAVASVTILCIATKNLGTRAQVAFTTVKVTNSSITKEGQLFKHSVV